MVEAFNDLSEGKLEPSKLRNIIKTKLSSTYFDKWKIEVNRKSKCTLFRRLKFDDSDCIESIRKGSFKMKQYVNILTTSNRLKFKLISGTHGLRSELSRRDKGDNTCMCCETNEEESVQHLPLDCPLYKDIRNDILHQIINLNENFKKEWVKGDPLHRCVMLLRDYGNFITTSLSSTLTAVEANNTNNTNIDSNRNRDSDNDNNNNNTNNNNNDHTNFNSSSLKNKIKLYKFDNSNIKKILKLIDDYILKIWERRLAFLHGPSVESTGGGANTVSRSNLASN